MNRSHLLFSALVLTACGAGEDTASPTGAPISVHLAPVSLERVARPVTATGVLGSKEEVALGFKIGGVIGRILVDEGQRVRAGDTLALLDLSEIDAGVARARSAAQKAERDLTRARRLLADSVATLEQAQNAETGHEVAQAELETASFNRRYAVIVAPSSGVILRRTAEPGEVIAPGIPILTLGSQARGVVIRAALADRDVVRIRRGDRATVRFDALPGTLLSGRVSEVGASADPSTGTFAVEVTVSGATGAPSGLVGHLEIHPAAERALPFVPIEAILEADGARATVFVLSADGRRAERRTVQIGFLVGDRVAIAAGLDQVRQVVTVGGAYLDDGAAVQVMP